MVELGTGEPQPRRFFFDLGNGSVENASAKQAPPALINDPYHHPPPCGPLRRPTLAVRVYIAENPERRAVP